MKNYHEFLDKLSQAFRSVSVHSKDNNTVDIEVLPDGRHQVIAVTDVRTNADEAYYMCTFEGLKK